MTRHFRVRKFRPRPRVRVAKTDASDFADLHRTADRLAPKITELWNSLGARFSAAESLASLEAAASGASTASINETLVSIFEGLGGEIEGVLAEGALAAGNVTADSMGISLSFDLLNPRAAIFARTRAAALIVEVTLEQQELVRQAVFRGIVEGRNPRDVARGIRSVVGLHERYATAVDKFRGRLLAEGNARAHQLADRYAERLLKSRAETIARTEMIRASNVGQREAWRTAQAEGLIDAEGAEREWIAAADVPNDICAQLDGTTVGFEEEFDIGDPPAHPRCRCAIGLRLA